MKRLILLLSLLLLFVLPGRAQTRFLIGGQGGEIYSNVFGSITGQVEVPVSRFEFDASGSWSPHLEQKVNLGSGYGYQYGTTGRAWFTKNLAVDGGVQESAYSVTATSKAEYFVNTGLTYRRLWLGIPTRFTFDYIREIANGVMPNGDETNHLNGASITIDGRLGCFSFTCIRMQSNFQVGHVLDQGNPLCDGTYGPVQPYCKRSGTVGGGGSISFLLEFPRRKQTENEPF